MVVSLDTRLADSTGPSGSEVVTSDSTVDVEHGRTGEGEYACQERWPAKDYWLLLFTAALALPSRDSRSLPQSRGNAPPLSDCL